MGYQFLLLGLHRICIAHCCLGSRDSLPHCPLVPAACTRHRGNNRRLNIGRLRPPLAASGIRCTAALRLVKRAGVMAAILAFRTIYTLMCIRRGDVVTARAYIISAPSDARIGIDSEHVISVGRGNGVGLSIRARQRATTPSILASWEWLRSLPTNAPLFEVAVSRRKRHAKLQRSTVFRPPLVSPLMLEQ